MQQSHSIDLYISPSGNDAWSGRLSEPNASATDGPFATLERARDELRRHPAPGATVWLRAGDYVLAGSFTLDARDSGLPDQPVTYRAYPGETARLLGGRRITNFCPVTDAATLARLDPAARSHVVESDLRTLGVEDFGQFRSRGLGRPTAPAHLELFFNGQPMTVARWPNEGEPAGLDAAPGFTRIAGWPEEHRQDDEHGRDIGNLAGGFFYEGDRPRRWATLDNVWLHGYWAWDWANSYEEVDTIDLERRLIKTKPPHGSWGFRTGNRFYYLNVLEELDQPGEYYVDRQAGKLYFWPPAPLADAEALVSVLETPVVWLKDASHITLRGCVIEAGRGMGIQIEGGAGVRIEDCTLRNLGNHAVTVEGGVGHVVAGCEMYGTGDGGVFVTGGDRKTLASCEHVIDNNHIHHLSRWSRCYTPAIHAAGVGIRMTHNLIHDLPHSGIIFWGNEMRIEYNEIHHVTLESADAGAIYTGRDFTARGNIIRYNYIHDTGGYDWGTMAVYLDDCVSGEVIYGNLFVRVQRAAFIGGGRDNVVENNIFVDCKPAVWVDARGLDQRVVWRNMIYKTMKQRLDAVNHHQPPYSERYPELQQLDAYYAADKGVPPEGNVVARNICAGGSWIESSWHHDAARYLTVVDNLVGEAPRFVDAAGGDYRLREDSPAFALGFMPIPLDQIGLRAA